MKDKKKKIVDIVSLVLIGVIIVLITIIAPTYQYGLLGVKPEMQIAKEGQIKVACVGDSLTYGTNVKNWKKNNYPTLLQNKLGNGYIVNNYGLPGATVLNSSKKYSSSKEFKNSLAFKPDLVIIMIGTNDSWANIVEIEKIFTQEYKELLNKYKEANGSVKFKILIPPKAFKFGKKELFYINDNHLEKFINPKITNIAEEEGITLINLRNEFSDKKKYYSSDKVHLNSNGTKKLASIIFESIK